MLHFWRCHSRTILCFALGLPCLIAPRFIWPDGGVDFDLITIVAGALVALGLEGIFNMIGRETARPED
ncbi:MAG TPA: hypothetical protein VEA41_23425 [Salinarimonas sp.]|nr:hypothetical protein [Salinarimonas sp.]